jgi:hypothetical protein
MNALQIATGILSVILFVLARGVRERALAAH